MQTSGRRLAQSSTSTVTYSNLASGNYQFSVQPQSASSVDSTATTTFSVAVRAPLSASMQKYYEINRSLLAKPGVIKARAHRKWPLRGLSSGTPDLNRLACSGIRREGGAQHAIEHTKPHPESVSMPR